MAAIHWQDTKGVSFLSTAADPYVTGGITCRRNSGDKHYDVPTSPIQIMYSRYMRGVDVSDQLRVSYSTQKRTMKWWHRVFFFLFDTTLTNAYLLYRDYYQRKEEKAMEHHDFQMSIAYALMGHSHPPTPIQAVVEPAATAPRIPRTTHRPHLRVNAHRVLHSSVRNSGQTCAGFVFYASVAHSTSVLAAASAFALANASWLTTKKADS